MSPRRFALLLFVLPTLAPAGAQTIATSQRPDHVAVTVYRDPDREASESFRRNWLRGYALISETRRIAIPAGESDIRFEGVAAGLIPQSVILTGLPEGIVERNRDTYLLSPATLLDRSLGRRVMLRRTSRATGAVREQEAVIRSGSGGAVVLQTAEGFEALRCTGLREALVYGEVPQGLSARPTLSVRARSNEPVMATLTLSYIANGFDWQADYIANISADESHVDLFAWLTLASNDETSFVDADTQAVAGRPNREQVNVQPLEGNPLTLTCWPGGRTHHLPSDPGPEDREERQPMMESAMAVTTVGVEDIGVTGARYVQAQQEDLGDLKLYRIPLPVTVAANSQKQVALLERTAIPVAFMHRQRFHAINSFEEEEVARLMVTRNRSDEGLGVPLPAGRLVLFDGSAGRPILVGDGFLEDIPVGAEVEVRLGAVTGLRSRLRRIRPRGGFGTYELTVTNGGPRDLVYEAEIGTQEVRVYPASPLGRRDGSLLWSVTVPANGRMSLRYRVEQDD